MLPTFGAQQQNLSEATIDGVVEFWCTQFYLKKRYLHEPIANCLLCGVSMSKIRKMVQRIESNVTKYVRFSLSSLADKSSD